MGLKQLKAKGFDWQQYQRQHVQAVDMVAAVIFAHRAKNIPIKAVHLTPQMHGQFKQWVERNLQRELEEGEKMEFDSVNVEEGSRGQSTPILIELWADRKPIMGIA